MMIETNPVVASREREIDVEYSQLMARILDNLVGMGADVKLSSRTVNPNCSLGIISEVNGVPVDIRIKLEHRERWSNKTARISHIVAGPNYGNSFPTATYPRDKHQQFSTQKLAERLDAVTRAVVAKKTTESVVATRRDKRAKELKALCFEKSGSEYGNVDYKRRITLENSDSDFTATIRISVKSIEELKRLVGELEQFVDSRAT